MNEVIRLSSDAAFVTLQHVQKNNDVVLTALCIQVPGEQSAPLIYLDDFFQQYRQGVPIAHLARLVLTSRQDHSLKSHSAISTFHNFSDASGRIFCKFINFSMNQERLLTLPHKRFLDLAITYYYQVDESVVRDASILITEAHRKHWNIPLEQLHQTAWENTQSQLPSRLTSMKDALDELLTDEEKEEIHQVSGSLAEPLPMQILTNSRRCLGAICILYPGVLSQAADLLAANLFVLPSSIHECILIPDTQGFSRKELEEMVSDINTSQVEPQEVLSNHVYFYSRKEDTLLM